MGKAVEVGKIVADKNLRRERQEIIKPSELVSAKPIQGRTLSLPALKAYNMMLKAAQANGYANVRYSVTKKALRRSHKGNERIAGLLDELHSVGFQVPGVLDGKKGLWRMTLLSPTFEEEGDDDTGSVHFQFPAELLEIIQESGSWSLMIEQVMVKFESVYGLRLYEIGCRHISRDKPFIWWTPEELREEMGVPKDAYQDWANLRRRVLDTAMAEVNQLAHFDVELHDKTIQRMGRKVVKFMISFNQKPLVDAERAESERAKHSAGRKARREGTVEKVVPTHHDAIRRLMLEDVPTRQKWYDRAHELGAPEIKAPAARDNIKRWIAWVDVEVAKATKL